jgi:hypothetical protein
VATDRELLLDLLRRVRLIEEHLGIRDPEDSKPFGRVTDPSGIVRTIPPAEPGPRSTTPSPQRVRSRHARPSSEESHTEGPITPPNAEGPNASEPGPVSGMEGVVRVGSVFDKQIARPAGDTSPQFPGKRQTDQPEDSSTPED